MKRTFIYGGISVVLIGLAVGFATYSINTKPVPKKDNKKATTLYVKTSKVSLTQTASDMKYRGRVTAFDNVSLGAEMQGKIMQGDVRFKAGEKFRKNDLLVKIYSENVKAALKSDISSFLQTLSKILPDIKVDYSEEYDKWFTFFNAIDVDKPLPQLPPINSNKEKIFLAANNVLSGYYTLLQQEINLSRYAIYAPFTGSFKSVNKEIGAVATPGAELATIIRSDKLEIIVPVFPADLKWIHKGDKVKIAKQNGLTKTASVSRISQFVDEATQSVNVYLTYQPNEDSSFLEGEYVDAIFTGVALNGFEIPREALVDKSFVYELNNDKLVKIPVNILRQLNDSYIIAGIDSNKVIVTESLSGINDNITYLAR
ncbi:efflux RND transporter periplasmic adaptor subunit [Geofilum sp. OHC36d9]|uniref:efflux RND transporter periplasmic adaptor subunit n=1 Tax=Geofilum sp. OHC36d9 TaxID=3458413 RepID=UPI004033F96F